jgi:D-alanyl-D-alanine carboxypeptidase (penicillin-binding protein 5/6)
MAVVPSSLRPRAAALLSALLAVLTLAFLLAPQGEAQQGKAGREGPQIDARGWILIDARDGTVLAAKNEAKTVPIASTTKMMTAYLALDHYRGNLDALVKAPAYDALPAESVLGLNTGERMSVDDLITAMMLPSANDAAFALANDISGSVPAFVDEMNTAAADLGLMDTGYANPIGLDDPGNGSSARDLASLANELMHNKRFRKIVGQTSATLETGDVPRTVETRNTLMFSDPTVDGVKTGHTLGAGYVLVASAERDGVPLISVVLGASSESGRDAATAALLDYGAAQYKKRTAVPRGEELGTIPVTEGDPESLTLEAGRPFKITARDDQEIAVELEAPAAVEGPIPEGDRLGEATVLLDGAPVGKVPAVAAFAVAEPGWLERSGGVVAVVLIAGGLILLAIAVLNALRRRREGERARATTAAERATLRTEVRRRSQENDAS